MYQRALLVLTVCLLIAVMSCDDSENSATGPDVPTVQAGHFIHVDTTQYFVFALADSHILVYDEIYLWWEENFGEPFTDVNDNGVYDPGIDIFIMGTGEDNMDLNHNGRYDGPDDPWEPGIPFDDIDGNGVCRQQLYYYGATTDPRDPLTDVPYFDANENGSLDRWISERRSFVRPVIVEETDSSVRWGYEGQDTAIYFVSDSGITYYPQLIHWPSVSDAAPFQIVGEKLLFHLTYPDKQVTLELISTATVSNDSCRIPFPEGTEPGSYLRQIFLDQTLIFDNDTTHGLLKIRCDQLQFDDESWNAAFEDTFWEFYFSSAHGLRATYYKAEPNDWEGSPQIVNYLKPLDGPLPLLLEK